MKERKGVAVGYTPNKPPEILAVAKGFLVDRLLKIAKENNITVYKDSDLAEILSCMKPGEIPENLFRVIAEILTYCYKTNEKFRDKIIKNGI